MNLVTFKIDGNTVTLELDSRDFVKSGKPGFGAYGKLDIAGKRYQLSCTLVELGAAKSAGLRIVAEG